jgi:radical SAM protein with 4Fe4S-binding SPASM domain
MTLMLSNRCVAHCRYCYADTQTPVRHPLPTTRLLELIDEAAALPVQQVNLIGGEVFLHPDWDTILVSLVEREIMPDFISTKIPLTTRQIERLQRIGYRNAIQVSLDALDTEILVNTIAVNANYAERMEQSLLRLDESGLPYQVSTVLTTANCRNKVMEQLFRFLSRLKHLNSWRITPVSNSIMKPYRNFAYLKPDKQSLIQLFDYIEEHLMSQAPFPIMLNREALNQRYRCDKGGSGFFHGARCSALVSHLFVLPDGNVTICEQLYWNPDFIIGNVRDTDLKGVWNSPQVQRLLNLRRKDSQRSSACRKCSIFEQCYKEQNRCWSNVIKAYGASCSDYPDPRCAYAPKLKNQLGYRE